MQERSMCGCHKGQKLVLLGVPVARLVLSNTWDKVEVPEDLENYVINGIESFRNGQGADAWSEPQCVSF